MIDQPREFALALGGLRFRRGAVSSGAFVGGLQRVRGGGQLPLERAPHCGGFGELRGQFGLALRESLDLDGRRGMVLPRGGQCGFGLGEPAFELISCVRRLRQLGVELRLAFGPLGRRRRHGRRVLLFGLGQLPLQGASDLRGFSEL